ncbi:MAG: hypothetical protein AB8I08_06070 [Sandaracinaceae bacterium]
MPAIDVLNPASRHLLLEMLRCVARESTEDEAIRGAEIALGVVDTPARSLPELPLSGLAARDRMLFYAAAVWMTLADGVRVRAETALLEVLRTQLRLDGETALFLERQSRWVRTSTGDLSPHRELDLLLTETARRLSQIEARQAA